MRELVLRPRIYDYHAALILEALREYGVAEEMVTLYEREFDIARTSELEVRANWEMGIIEDFFKAEGAD